MEKLESLKLLLEKIESEKKLSHGKYCLDNCHCAIGHLLLLGGATKKDLEKMDKKLYGSYGINGVMNFISIMPNKESDNLYKVLSSLGFNVENANDKILLSHIQHANDTRGRAGVIELLKSNIKKLEEAKLKGGKLI